jgi:16S rRNA (guanine527-N7)-methyltransferase
MADSPGELGGAGDVSRETSSVPDPVVLAEIFPPDRLSLLHTYAELLATEGVVRGLIGPREVPRLWDRHLVNCGLIAPLIASNATVADIGSGAGLPGVVLAVARPDVQMTLVEPMARRVAFLEEVRTRLSLGTLEIVRQRAEQWPDPPSFDVVTARALAPLPKLLQWGLPLTATDGMVLAMKGASAGDEIEAAQGVLHRWQARAEVLAMSVPGSSVTTVVRVVREPGAGIGWQSSRTHRRRGGRR